MGENTSPSTAKSDSALSFVSLPMIHIASEFVIFSAFAYYVSRRLSVSDTIVEDLKKENTALKERVANVEQGLQQLYNFVKANTGVVREQPKRKMKKVEECGTSASSSCPVKPSPELEIEYTQEEIENV